MSGRAHKIYLRKGAAAMYGPLVVAAAILISIAGIVLYFHDLSEARARRRSTASSRKASGAVRRGPGTSGRAVPSRPTA
jgi:hypothetical protein